MITFKSLLSLFSGPLLALMITFGFLLIIIAVRYQEFKNSSYHGFLEMAFLKLFSATEQEVNISPFWLSKKY